MAEVYSSNVMKNLVAQKESDYKKQVIDGRRLREAHMKNIEDVREKNDQVGESLKRDYEVKFSQEKNDLEEKLHDIREKYAVKIAKENERFEAELSDLKKAHVDQVAELKTTQVKDIDRMQRQQREFMENSKAKFESEKVKARV